MSRQPEKSRREEYSDATRTALLEAARKLFTAQGYQATGIEAVARAARVTRGALYHHFADKRALLDALVVELQQEAARAVADRVRGERDMWARLRIGLDAYLDACLGPAFRRLVIQEAPAVLGTARCREIDHTHTLGPMIAGLTALRKAGELDFPDPALLARMIAAMFWEAALLIVDAKDPKRLRVNARDAIDRILATFRPR
jgi:AcrR family transcriptional regulator